MQVFDVHNHENVMINLHISYHYQELVTLLSETHSLSLNKHRWVLILILSPWRCTSACVVLWTGWGNHACSHMTGTIQIAVNITHVNSKHNFKTTISKYLLTLDFHKWFLCTCCYWHCFSILIIMSCIMCFRFLVFLYVKI